MSHVTDHEVHILDQEIDAVQICPSSPNHLVVATYMLIRDNQYTDTSEQHNEDSSDETCSGAKRIGSLQILPIERDISALAGDHMEFATTRLDFPCAILDIHFCPSDDSLLCAATSLGELRFFHVSEVSSNPRSSVASIQIVPLDVIKLHTNESNEDKQDDEQDDDITPPLITQFTWITSEQGVELDSHVVHYLAASDTMGRVILVQVVLSEDSSSQVADMSKGDFNRFSYRIQIVHKHLHNLEAWTVSNITTPTTDGDMQQILLSGGDDSCLIASSYAFNRPQTTLNTLKGSTFLETPPARIYLDKHTHTAGVISITSLPADLYDPPDRKGSSRLHIPVLTGSYDQHLRLFIFDRSDSRLAIASELALGGGVWRTDLIDSYCTLTDEGEDEVNYILLVSAMHAGSYIVRLIRTLWHDNVPPKWRWVIEARFTSPHESMVYACTAKAVSTSQMKGLHRAWKIISTSFYDKRICLWEWIDVQYAKMITKED